MQIKKFGILQTAKLFAAMYFISTLIFMVPLGILMLGITLASGNKATLMGTLPMAGVLILSPVIYGIISFIMIAIMCLVYNIVAKYIGGIEIELGE